MDTKHLIKLPSDLLERCAGHGEQMAADYAAGMSPNSRAVSSHGMEANGPALGVAKMAECAFALWAGMDPLAHVSWERRADGGCDLLIPPRCRVDVKNTKMDRRFLIWPINKRGFYQEKQFDVLVLVKDDIPSFLVRGWISKQDFFIQHDEAPEGHKLTPGTWFMDESDLMAMDAMQEALALPLTRTTVADFGTGLFPDLQVLVRSRGGYHQITPNDWAEFDRLHKAAKEKMNHGQHRRTAKGVDGRKSGDDESPMG